MHIVRNQIHPAGESSSTINSALSLDSYSGKLHIQWEPQAKVTGMGQLSFFIDFLKLGDRFSPLVESCPLRYTSNNAPSKRSVLGSLLLSVLSGHKRYAHLGSLRYDGVNAKLLGMDKVVSSDSARRALQSMDEGAGSTWLSEHLDDTYRPLLKTPWILDIDATIKTIYGHQEGAVVAYNPHKPGRPSHVYHTYLIANLRLVLDVEVVPGNESHAQYALPGLIRLLSALSPDERPQLVRGDCDYGNERVMCDLEAMGQSYLFKLRKSANVKKLIMEHHASGSWKRFKKDWQAKSATLQLCGWSKARRVIIVRRKLPQPEPIIALEYQQQLAFIDGPEEMKWYDYAVLVTDVDHSETQLIQQYRDRADAENYFDEVKNQWGWAGFTTHDLKRCRFMAKFIALVYNWWTLFVRCYEPNKHTEAMTSRPLLLSSIGRLTQSGRQQTLTITNTHEDADKVQQRFTELGLFFNQLRATAQQLTDKQRWKRLLQHAMRAFSLIGFSPPLLLTYSPA